MECLGRGAGKPWPSVGLSRTANASSSLMVEVERQKPRPCRHLSHDIVMSDAAA